MAKFCTKCGTPLTEGQPCTCELQTSQATLQQEVAQQNFNNQSTLTNNQENVSAQQGYDNAQASNNGQALHNGQPSNNGQSYTNPENFQQYQQQFNKAKEQSSIYLKNALVVFMNILKKPAELGSQFAKSANYQMAMGLIVFQAIMTALFSLVVTSKFNSIMTSAAKVFDSEVSAADKFPLVKIFFVAIIVSVALSCALAGILYVLCQLMKNPLSYKHMLCVVATRSVAVVPITLLAIVLFYIKQDYGILLFYAGNLFGICYMLVSLPATSRDNQNIVPFIVFSSIIIFAILSYFVMKQCIPFYLPENAQDSWKEASKNLSKINLSNWSSLLGNIY